MNADILIRNCTIITMNTNREIIYSGAVATKGNEIVYVGRDEGASNITAEKVIDGTNHLVLPGLIDTHAHAGHGLTKSLGEGGVEGGWDQMMEHVYYRSTTEDFWHAEAQLSGLEKLLFGVTTGVSMLGSAPRFDNMKYVDAHVKGMKEIGIRDFVCVGTPNPPFPKHFRDFQDDKVVDEYSLDFEDSFAITEEIVKKHNNTNEGLTYACPGPSYIGYRKELTIEENILVNKKMHEIAVKYDTQLHGHSYAGDIEFLDEHFPEILSDRVFTAHVTGISEKEIEIIAKTGVHVCSGPSTTAYILARCPVVELIDAGASVNFCTDASAPDRNYDLLPKLRVGARLHRSHFNNGDLLTPGKLLEMITVDAARALGMQDKIGSIEDGKFADIIAINLNKPHLYPLWLTPLRAVYQASGSDIDTVIVNGKLKVHDYKLVDINQAEVLRYGQEEAMKMIKRANLEDKLVLPETFWNTHY
jgi:cytosine/adenosine deaminase-related metal-dependent hydrolase